MPFLSTYLDSLLSVIWTLVIDLELGTRPIPIAPFNMAPTKPYKLKF